MDIERDAEGFTDRFTRDDEPVSHEPETTEDETVEPEVTEDEVVLPSSPIQVHVPDAAPDSPPVEYLPPKNAVPAEDDVETQPTESVEETDESDESEV